MKTKPFKEIIPIKKLSSGPTNSADKLSPLKSMGVWQDSLARRYFLLFDFGDVCISLYLIVRSSRQYMAVLRTVGEYYICYSKIVKPGIF